MNVASATYPDNPAAVAQNMVVKSSIVQSADTSISTAEGDKVTISDGTRLDAAYSSYAQLARGAGSTTVTRADVLSLTASRQFSISVEGNLNHREIQDIRRAVHYIDKAARELLSGDVDGAQHKLQNLDKLKTLSAIGADLQVQNSLSVEQLSMSA